MGSYFRFFFVCLCVCGETLFLYVRTEAAQSEIGQSLEYTPGYVDVMDTPTFWAKSTPISPGTPPSASRGNHSSLSAASHTYRFLCWYPALNKNTFLKRRI